MVERVEGESMGRAVEMAIHDKSHVGIFYHRTRVDPQIKMEVVQTILPTAPFVALAEFNFLSFVPLVKPHTGMAKVRAGTILLQHLQEVFQLRPLKYDIAGEPRKKSAVGVTGEAE
jgi:hypothetical protein